MTNIYTERCKTLLTIREMQIKIFILVTYNDISTKMSKIKKTSSILSISKDVDQCNSYTADQ